MVISLFTESGVLGTEEMLKCSRQEATPEPEDAHEHPLCDLTEPAEADTTAVYDPKPVAIIEDQSLQMSCKADASTLKPTTVKKMFKENESWSVFC